MQYQNIELDQYKKYPFFKIKNILASKFLAGSGAGLAMAWITFPFESLQVNNMRGMVPFYRGLGRSAVHNIPTSTIQFGIKGMLDKRANTTTTLGKLCTSIVAGCTGALTATAVENTIIRQQTDTCRPIQALHSIFSNRGVMGPLKGYGLIAARDSIFTSWMFLINPKVKEYAGKVDSRYVLPATIVNCMLGALLSHPIDTVATSVQATHSRLSYMQAAKAIMESSKSGFTFTPLFRGIIYRMFLFTAFCNILPEVATGIEHGFKHGYLQGPFFRTQIDNSSSNTDEDNDTQEISSPKI